MAKLSTIKLISAETMALMLFVLACVGFWQLRALSNQIEQAQVETEHQVALAETALAESAIAMNITQEALQVAANAEASQMVGTVNALQATITAVVIDQVVASSNVQRQATATAAQAAYERSLATLPPAPAVTPTPTEPAATIAALPQPIIIQITSEPPPSVSITDTVLAIAETLATQTDEPTDEPTAEPDPTETPLSAPVETVTAVTIEVAPATLTPTLTPEPSLVASLVPTAVPDLVRAQEDSYFLEEDTVLNIDGARGVLNNDADAAGGGLSVTDFSSTVNGEVAVNSNGGLIYRPKANYNGDDAFTYTVCNQSDTCASTSVSLSIIAVNDSPDAADDAFQLNEDVSARDLTADLLANDIDADDDDLTIISIESVSSSSITFSAGSVRYTPEDDLEALAEDDSISDSFTYLVEDAEGETSRASVTITVSGENDAPVAGDDPDVNDQADGLTFGEDEISFNVTAILLDNDSDLDDGEQATLVITAVDNDASGGEAVRTSLAGDVEYHLLDAYQHLNDGETIRDRFSYAVTDVQGATSNIALVTVTITGSNDAPHVDTATTSPVSLADGEQSVVLAPALELSDVDDAMMQSARLELVGTLPDGSSEFLSFSGRGGQFVSVNGVLTVDEPLETAAMAALLRSINYENRQLDDDGAPSPTPGCRSVLLTVTDEHGASSEPVTLTVAVGTTSCATTRGSSSRHGVRAI